MRGAYRNVDLALMRRVPVGAGNVIEVRAEVFNRLNTPRSARLPPLLAPRASARSRPPATPASSSSR